MNAVDISDLILKTYIFGTLAGLTKSFISLIDVYINIALLSV